MEFYTTLNRHRPVLVFRKEDNKGPCHTLSFYLGNVYKDLVKAAGFDTSTVCPIPKVN